VPMRFMDGLSEQTRRALGLQDSFVHDGMGHPAGYRPGFCFAAVSDELTDRAMRARDRYIRNLADAWKNPLSERTTKQSSPRSSNDEAEQAYRAYVDRLTNAWRSR
jgi:hypothetical protein